MECACKQISILTQKKGKFPVPATNTESSSPQKTGDMLGDKGDYLQHVLKLPQLWICFKAAETEICFNKAVTIGNLGQPNWGASPISSWLSFVGTNRAGIGDALPEPRLVQAQRLRTPTHYSQTCPLFFCTHSSSIFCDPNPRGGPSSSFVTQLLSAGFRAAHHHSTGTGDQILLSLWSSCIGSASQEAQIVLQYSMPQDKREPKYSGSFWLCPEHGLPELGFCYVPQPYTDFSSVTLSGSFWAHVNFTRSVACCGKELHSLNLFLTTSVCFWPFSKVYLIWSPPGPCKAAGAYSTWGKRKYIKWHKNYMVWVTWGKQTGVNCRKNLGRSQRKFVEPVNEAVIHSSY